MLSNQNISELSLIKHKAETSTLFFTRYFFKALYNRKYVIGEHHGLISEALDKVISGEITRLIINIAPRYGKCVHLSTMILTTNGLKRADEIQSGDYVYSYRDGKVAINKCTGTERTQKQSVKIKMRSGRELICSYDHPMLTTFGYIEAEKLKTNERIVALNTPIDGSLEFNIDELTFVSLMIFEGDCGNKNIRFSNEDKCIVDLFYTTCNNLGINIKQYHSSKKCDHVVMGGNIGVAAKILERYGIRGHKCYTKRIPKEFFSLSLKQKLYFLDLMFATDGYVNVINGTSGVTLANRGLVEDIQHLFASIGIISTMCYKKNKCANAWCLTVSRQDTQKLTGMITFFHKRKNALKSFDKVAQSIIDTYPVSIITREKLTYKTQKPPYRCASGKDITREKYNRLCKTFPELLKYKTEDFYYDKIISIENVGVQDLVHLEVENDHNYIANGLVSHNTELAVKNFIAKGLAVNPSARFIHLSYSDDLALDNSESVKDIVKSPEYQQLFPNVKVKAGSDSKKKWYTSANGGVYATSAAGQVTGFGAGTVDDEENSNFIETGNSGIFGGALIIDDPIKPEDGDSETLRERINQRYDSTIKNRVNSRNTPIIIIMQRVHENDLCGYLIAQNPDEWTVLSLPCIKPDGTVLWEFKHTLEELQQLQKDNPIVFGRQYMQDPQPLKGLLFPPNEIQYYNPNEIKEFESSLGYCDIADEGSDSLSAVIGRNVGDITYITDVVFNKENADVTMPLVAELLIKNKVEFCRVESNNMGAMFGRGVQKLVPNTSVLLINNSTNKHTRILMESNHIMKYFRFVHHDYQTSDYRGFMKELCKYMKEVKVQAKDDAPDSLSGLSLFIRSFLNHLYQ